MSRFLLIHRWQGSPSEGWLPWLKTELERDGHEVIVPAMPDPEHPKIQPWVAAVRDAAVAADRHTFFVGHSIGNQAVLRWLQGLPLTAEIGGMVLVTPWVRLKPGVLEDEEDEQIAKPWLETPIHWEAIGGRSDHFHAIFSDDDYYVPLEDAKIFQNNLGAEIVVEHGKGHLSGEDGITELPSALQACRAMAGGGE